jgi:hypothetical protein
MSPPGMGFGNTRTPYRKSFGYCGNREDLSRGPLNVPKTLRHSLHQILIEFDGGEWK